MPEVTDVERFRTSAASLCPGRRITRVVVHSPEMLSGCGEPELEAALEGGRFSETGRRGKRLFFRAGGGPWLVIHFGMTGSLEYEPAARPGVRTNV